MDNYAWNLSNTQEKEYTVELEKFEKTEQRIELDKILIRSGHSSTGSVTLYDNILSTFEKYMWKYGSTNIKVKTDLVAPQIYKVGMHEIEIIY
ncbi:MAG: hypothetical protein ACJAVA_000197 [Flavobacteriaceae bacterium]|jgi:hypothetical protein